MKKHHKIILLLILTLVITACKKQGNEADIDAEFKASIPFKIARNYFVKNNVTASNLTLESKKEFNAVFGKAFASGADGSPTPIDFSKQYVVAIIKPETDLASEITIKSIKKDNENIVFTYNYSTGKKQSFTTRPSTIVILNKTEKRTIIFNELKNN